MNGNEYLDLAMRTNDGFAFNRLNKFIKRSDVNTAELLNGCLGLTGEAGEVADLIKKSIFQESEFDIVHLKKELGDVMWYIAMICNSTGLSLEDVMESNIDKLKKRYPKGFDTYLANNRKDGDI